MSESRTHGHFFLTSISQIVLYISCYNSTSESKFFWRIPVKFCFDYPGTYSKLSLLIKLYYIITIYSITYNTITVVYNILSDIFCGSGFWCLGSIYIIFRPLSIIKERKMLQMWWNNIYLKIDLGGSSENIKHYIVILHQLRSHFLE